MRTLTSLAGAVTACTLLCGCAVGPDYQRPSAPLAARFKEAQGWRPAAPREADSGSGWWTVYDDPVLDDLEQQLNISNQTLKASEAAWRQAVALVQQARAGLFPVLSVGTTAEHASVSADSGASVVPSSTGTTKTGTANDFTAMGSASWDIDVWGKIRRSIESDVATAQASEADLAAARLSAQATLATDYVELRVLDEQKQLLDETVDAYQRSLQITKNQYQVGVAAKSDVITAETQLEGAQSQRIGLGVTRSQLEHAIAMLIGRTPAEFSIPSATLGATIPVAPTGVASSLLERRPDIAEAERKMAAANAQIGVAIAAYYPDLTLSAAYGFEHSAVSGLFASSSRLWSVGGNLTDTVLDFNARRAQVAQTRAAYDGAVANYRQTVLSAFQQVEDQLAALRILEDQDTVQTRTVDSANQAVRLTLNEYKAGTVAFTTVVTAQTTALADAQTLLTIRQSRLVASVALIQALGGGWSVVSL